MIFNLLTALFHLLVYVMEQIEIVLECYVCTRLDINSNSDVFICTL